MDASTNNTHLILDLRDRMARIETKLDGHYEAHVVIDRRLEKLEAGQEALETRLGTATSDIAIGKARVATVGAIGGGVMAILGLIGDHLWNLIR